MKKNPPTLNPELDAAATRLRELLGERDKLLGDIEAAQLVGMDAARKRDEILDTEGEVNVSEITNLQTIAATLAPLRGKKLAEKVVALDSDLGSALDHGVTSVNEYLSKVESGGYDVFCAAISPFFPGGLSNPHFSKRSDGAIPARLWFNATGMKLSLDRIRQRLGPLGLRPPGSTAKPAATRADALLKLIAELPTE